MSKLTSESIRATLRDLESTAESAGAKLLQCEADHRSALRASIEAADCTLAVTTEAALEDARREHARATTSVEVARQLLAERVKAEKDEHRAAVRAKVEAELDAMAELAKSADEDFARLVGKIRSLRAMELALHSETRQSLGQAPWLAPQSFNAFRALATFASAMAHGVDASMKPLVSEAVEGARKNITSAYHG
jgi:hypothetical protein